MIQLLYWSLPVGLFDSFFVSFGSLVDLTPPFFSSIVVPSHYILNVPISWPLKRSRKLQPVRSLFWRSLLWSPSTDFLLYNVSRESSISVKLIDKGETFFVCAFTSFVMSLASSVSVAQPRVGLTASVLCNLRLVSLLLRRRSLFECECY